MIWCELSKREIPKFLTPKAKEVLLKVDFEEFEEEDRSYMFERLLDEPREEEVRQEVKDILEKAKVLVYS